MTPNEISLVKYFVDTLEKKNERVTELSILEYQKKIQKINKNWLERHNNLLSDFEELVESLKKHGFINQEMRDKYGIVSK
jgi:hypothetical protein